MNLVHLLNLVQVTDSKNLPPVCEALARASKHQQLLVLQRTFNTAAEATMAHQSAWTRSNFLTEALC